MSSPEVPEQPPVAATSEPASPPQEAAPPAAQASPPEVAPAETAPAGDAPAGDAPAGDAPAGEEGAASGEGGGEAGVSQEAAAPAADGQPKKKRRRRRRKKKPGTSPGAEAGAAAEAGEAEGDAEGADGEATDEGSVAGDAAAAGEGARPAGDAAAADKGKKKKRRKKDKPKAEPRERPAFNLGDVVFGKIVEVTFHSLFIDLPGKGIAIFDRREEEIPDDLPPLPDEHDDDASDADAREPAKAEPEAAAPGPAQGEAASSPDALEPAAGAEAVAEAPAAAPEAVNVEAKPAKPAEKKPEKREEPPLPPLVCEVGAHFVGVVHNDGARGGHIVVTRHPKRWMRARATVATAFRDKREVSALVTGAIKGGMEVDVDGLRGFVPASHMDLRLGADLTPHVGKRYSFAVTQYAKKGRDLVLSRKTALEAEAKALREEALGKLEIGAVVDGTVTGVVPFGAFIDVGGVEGLVPLAEMSHNRADQPSDVFKSGETVQVKIVRVDEKGKVWLSRKAAIPDPWGDVAKKYAPWTRHAGKVARLQPFGAFVELEPGIDGLIHAADLSLKRFDHPNEIVKEGDAIEVVVSSIDSGAHKIGLHPALTGDAAEEPRQKVVLHKPVKAKVVQAESGGLVVRICGVTGRNARGYVPASATGTPRGTELRKEFPVGKEIEAKVIELDPRRGEAKLSIRALSQDNERNAYRQYREQVNREAKFGTFGDLLAKKLQKDG